MLDAHNYTIASNSCDYIDYENHLLLELENFSRVFRYLGIYACTISFSLKNYNDQAIQLYMNLTYMIKNKNPKKIRLIKEHKRFKSLLIDTYRLYSFKFINCMYF